LLGCGDNSAIKDRHPAEYMPEYENRFTSDEVADFYRDSALLDQWYHIVLNRAAETDGWHYQEGV